MEPVDTVMKNFYQRNTYRKDLSWPYFDNEPRVQKTQQAKDQQSCIFAFVACQVDTPSISSKDTLIFTVCNWLLYIIIPLWCNTIIIAYSLDITKIYRIGKSVVLFGLIWEN